MVTQYSSKHLIDILRPKSEQKVGNKHRSSAEFEIEARKLQEAIKSRRQSNDHGFSQPREIDNIARQQDILAQMKELAPSIRNINYQDEMGNTALHYAVEDRLVDVVKYLLEIGADFAIKNNNEYTPKDRLDYYSLNDHVSDNKYALQIALLFKFIEISRREQKDKKIGLAFLMTAVVASVAASITAIFVAIPLLAGLGIAVGIGMVGFTGGHFLYKDDAWYHIPSERNHTDQSQSVLDKNQDKISSDSRTLPMIFRDGQHNDGGIVAQSIDITDDGRHQPRIM